MKITKKQIMEMNNKWKDYRLDEATEQEEVFGVKILVIKFLGFKKINYK